MSSCPPCAISPASFTSRGDKGGDQQGGPDAALVPGHVLKVGDEQPLAPGPPRLESDAVPADVIGADHLFRVGADVQLIVDDLGIPFPQRRPLVDVVYKPVGRVVGTNEPLKVGGLGGILAQTSA